MVAFFFGFSAIFAELVAVQAIGAFVGIEAEEENRESIEQPKDRPEGTAKSAPGTSLEEHRDHKQNHDNHFGNARPYDGFSP